ncbi:MAG: glycosyltransferase [Pseudomonadota bacterium]
MQKPKKIFVISDFKDESPSSIRIAPRMWIKGLIRRGHDVQRFSYRNVMMQCSPLPGKRIARHFAKKKTDLLLVEQIKRYHPDIIFILSMKYLDADSVVKMRNAAGNAVFISRDDDPFPDKNPSRIATAKQTDIVITTSCGRFLRTYKDHGVPCCAFLPNICDPDIQYRYKVEEKWKADIIFTGKSEHTRLDRYNERYHIVQRLSQMPGARICGAFGNERVDGIDYFYAISGAKIGLSINIANDVRLYHSDRFINYISCGTFTLAKRVPDTDLLFQDGEHVKYFDTADEFFELADWYLKHEQEREKIAEAGMKRARSEFNAERMAKHMLDLIETGSYDAPWAEIL